MFDRIDGVSSLSTIYYFNDYLFSFFSYFVSLTGLSYKGYLLVLFIFCISFMLFAYQNIFINGIQTNLKNRNQNLFFFILAVIFLFCSSTIYLFAVNAVRQFMAISLFLYGFSLFLSGKSKKSYLFLILAFLSHSSAFLLILALLISRLFKLRIITVGALVMIPILYFAGPLQIGNFFSILGFNFLGDKIINLSAPSTGAVSELVKYCHALIICFFVLFVNSKVNNPSFKKIALFYVTYVFIVGATLFSPIMATRFLLYCGIFEPIILAFSLYFLHSRQRVVFVTLFFMLSLFYMSYLYFFNSTIRSQLIWEPCYGCYLNEYNSNKFIDQN